MTAYVYILASQKNGTLYIGVTTQLGKRIGDHKAGVGSAFTAKYKVTRLVYLESFDEISAARAREASLKHWRRGWKITLIEKENPRWLDLYEQIL